MTPPSIAARLREVAKEAALESDADAPIPTITYMAEWASRLRSLAGEIEETSKYLRDAAGNTLRLDDLRALPNKVEYVASRLAAPEEK